MSRKLIAILGAFGFLASTGLAFAQDATTTPPVIAPAPAATSVSHPMVLQIGPKGAVLLRGTIDSVSSASVTVKSWGGDWTVNVPTSAQVLPAGTALSSFQQGDFVGVQGTVDSTGGFTVNATLIRDWTVRQALNQQIKANVQSVRATMASGPRVVQGTLSNLDATAETFTLTNAGGTAYSVTLDSSAKILGRNWATIALSQVNSGDTVRVYGPVSSTTIAASVFRDVSVK